MKKLTSHRYIFILVLLYLNSYQLIAQEEYIFGRVTQEELDMTVYEADTSAAAVVLFEYGQISIDEANHTYKLTHHVRIKLLEESALQEYGEVKLKYYSKDKIERIGKIQAQVILANNQRIKLDEEAFYEEDVSEYTSAINFAFPNLEVGAIVEYEYELRSTNIIELHSWYFQRDIPVKHSLITVTFPRLYNYLYFFQGGEYLEKLPDGTVLFNGVSKVLLGSNRYEMWTIPAFKEQAFITCRKDYIARIRFQLSEVYRPAGGIVEQYYTEKILSSWDEIGEKLIGHEHFGWKYKRKKYYNDLFKTIQPLIPPTANEYEKASIVYQYLAKNIEWNGYDGVFADQSSDKAFEAKIASKPTINLTLLAILNELGIEARPVLTSTRAHGKVLPKYPIFDQFNYVIVQATLDGEPTFLDIGSKLRPMGYPEERALNYQGWAINIDGSNEWIDIEVGMSQSILTFKGKIEGEQLIGTAKAKTNGYAALNERLSYQDDKTGAYWSSKITGYAGNAGIREFKVEDFDNAEAWFYNEFELKVDGCVVENGDFLYISPILYSDIDENPFKENKRYYPIDFPYPFYDQYVFELSIPEGYQIEQLPDPIRVALPNDGGYFYFSVFDKGESIQLLSRIRVEQLKFEPIDYSLIKQLYDIIVEKQNEQIVFKKSQ